MHRQIVIGLPPARNNEFLKGGDAEMLKRVDMEWER